VVSEQWTVWYPRSESPDLGHPALLTIPVPLNQNRGIMKSMETIHISEADAVRDFAGLLAHARLGTEIVIESVNYPPMVLRTAAPPRRSISESIALAEARTKELGYKPVMDADFAADLEEIIRNRKPRDTSAWD